MANKRNKWNEQEQGAKRRRSNQSTTKPQPAASNPNKNAKSTDTRRNSGTAAKPAPKPAAPKAKPKQSVTYYSNKNKGARGVAQSAARAVTQKPRVQTAAKDTAKRAEHRLARQTGVQQFVTGRNIPTVMNKPKTFQQTVTPLEQMKADAIAGPRYWSSRATVPSKPLTAEEQKKKTQQTAKQSGFNARARNQTLSQWDQKLPDGPKFQIAKAKQRFDEAEASGDMDAARKAHMEAENIRRAYGYSGGASGDEHITGKLTQDDYNRLNKTGQTEMSKARLDRSRATTEEEIARADRRIEEILNAPGYQNGRDINTARGMRETAEGRSTMLGATREQREKDAAGMKNATLAGIHLGVGGTGHWLEATDWTIANRNRDQNMAKWLQDADDYESARSDLEYYDNYVQTFGEPPAGMNRNVLQMRLNDAIQARAQLERMQTDPHSAYYDETVARRMGLPTDTQSYWEKMIRQGQQEQLASQEGLSPAEKWINDLYISGIQTIPTTAAALIPGGQGGALAGLASAARGLTLAGMGASAAGNRMTELQDAGYAFDKAYRDATISGIIEAGTEMIGVEKLASAAAGKVPQNALRAILEQGLAEGGEEALSYALNTGYNKLTDLPGQEWSWKDFASQTAGGAIMGAVHMGAGVMINSLAASGAVSQERAQRSYQAWQASADQARSLLNDAKQWYAMIDQGAVSREEGEAALSQVSQQINGQAEPVTREWLARQEELLDIEENAIRGAITRQEARDQQSQIMDQMTSQNRDAEANRMAAEWDEEERQARAAQNAAVSARTRLDQRLEDWRWRQEEPVSSNPVEEAKQMTAEALRATDAEMARREAAQTVQAETPPVQWERSGLPPTSFLGAAIDARREARARAGAEAQVRRDQEAARQNRVAATAEESPSVPTFVPNAPVEQQNVTVSYQNQQAQQPASRLERLASTFGESGAASLRTIGGKMITGQGAFVRDFTDVYNQVLGGRSESQVSRPAGMSDANFFAAVTAAKNDRQTGWDLDILKASKAAGRNVNAGVDWRDQYVRQMDRKTARIVDGLAKALGVKVVFAEQGTILTAGGARANAEITGNVVRIEKGNPNPVRMLIGHELTHRMQDLSPESYQAFRDYVMSIPGSMEALERTVSIYQGAKAFRAEDNVRQMAMDEVTADYAGALLENSEQLQEFIRRNYENRTMLEVIRDFFRDLAAKLSGREKAQADEAVRLLEEAIKGSSERVKEIGNTIAQMGVDLATNAAEAEEYGRFSLVTDKNTLDFLENQDHVTVYRAMQVIDGKLYPPMAAKVKSDDGEKTLVEPQKIGEWYRSDEKPELIPKKKTVTDKKTGETREQGYFILDKGDGSTPLNVAYNPYFHTSASPLNDQFSSAHKRPNLVTVECEIPKNELSSGYRAEFAKDTVGETKWHAGPVASKLKGAKARRVFLSRWAKVNRIVPDAEVAQVIAKTLEGEDVAVPTNVVTPSLLVELRKQGVKIEEIEGKGGDTTEESSPVETAAKAGVLIDEETESANAARFSLGSWNRSEYVQDRDAAAKALAKQLKVTQKEAKRFIDSVNSVAKIIADDRARLDYLASPGRSPFVSNVEYGGSIDFSTICKKRRLFTGTIDAIQRAMPDRVLMADEMLKIRAEMKKRGYEVGCGLCYVEGSRVKIGKHTKEFLDGLKAEGAEYVPTLAEMNTVEGQEEIRLNHPETYEKYVKFMNKLAQRKPKLFQMATEYQREILDAFEGKEDSVKEKNKNGGLRLQSFSDFEIIHLIDSMQVILDMSRVGLGGQAYTKQPEFAWALGETGLKINLSLIAKGVDENGRLIFDDVEGMPIKDAMELRDRYSKNVGTVIVVFNDQQILAALADDRIDFVLPFHRSQWNKKQYDVLGLPQGTKDYTLQQNEKYILPVQHKNRNGKMVRERPANYMPNEYWNFRRTGKWNAEQYLKMCAENNRRPKFFKLLVNNGDGSYSLQPDGSTDGYWKLLIDFKMYDNEGEGSPQKPVRPEFNMDEAQRMLKDYEGGHENFPVAQDIVDEFVGGARFSISPQADADGLRQVWAKAGQGHYIVGGDTFTLGGIFDNLTVNIPASDQDTLTVYEAPRTDGFVDGRYIIGDYINAILDNGNFVTHDRENKRYTVMEAVKNEIAILGGEKEPGVFYRITNNKKEISLVKSGRMHNSVNHANAEEELGVSVWDRIIYFNQKYAYKVTGDVVAVGADGEPVLDPKTMKVIGHIKPVEDLINDHLVAQEKGKQKFKEKYNWTDEQMYQALNGGFKKVYLEDIIDANAGRYSLSGPESLDSVRLMRENQLLREKLDYWKGQTKRSDRTKADPKEVKKLAGKLAKDFSTEMDAGEIAGRLQTIYDGIGKDWTYDQAYEEAGKLAREMIEQASETDNYLYAEYAPMREFFKDQALVVTPEMKRAIPDYGEWRKSQFGKLRLQSGDQTNVDQVFQEAAQLWPEWFSEEVSSSSLDQLERIAEVMDGIYTRDEVNPFEDDMAAPAGYLAAEIMDRFWDMPAVKKTFADRAEARLGREVTRRLDMQERYENALQRVRENRDKKLKQQKEKYLGREKARSQRQKERELRGKILRHCKKLSTKLRTPTDTQHIPEGLRDAVATALNSINLSSKDSKDTKRTTAFADLQRRYQDILNEGSSIVIDPDLLPNISDIIGFADTPIENLGTQDLEIIWRAVRAIEASISTANKALGKAKFETISQPAFGIRDYLQGRKDRGDYRGPIKAFDKLMNFGMLTPEGFFSRLGKSGTDIFKMLRAAQDHHISIMQDAQKWANKLVKGWNIKRLEKETQTFDFDGQSVTLSKAQIMSLYELMKRQQAIDHIMVGGLRPETVKRGVKERTPSEPWHLTQDQVAEIVGSLPDEEVKLADEMQQYMEKVLAELGNEASLAVYGYRKFTEKHYFPIAVDKNETVSDVKNDAVSGTIAGWGSARPVKPNARNALIVRSIFDVFADHTTEMANYAAWLGPMENFNRIFNFRYKNEAGDLEGGVKTMLERAFGKNGPAYWRQLQDDLNNGVHGRNDNPFQALIGAYKGSAIGANIRVIAQQPTAILRALDEINPADFIAGVALSKPGKYKNVVMKYAPIAVWKNWGYFTADTGRQMRNVLFNDDSGVQKLNNFLMQGAGTADSVAWTHIWNAVEVETRRKRKDLKPGSGAFYEAVAERFGDIVDHTQVVDGILQRSQIMRSPDNLTKMATSFMAEPTKVYNMMTGALYDARNATGAERSKAMRKLARTSVALLASFVANAAAQSLVDALRDDDKDEEYWQKFFQAFWGGEGDSRGEQIRDAILNGNVEAAFNPATYIPWAKDIVSLTQGFNVSRMDMDTISRVMKEIGNTMRAMNGEGKLTKQNAILRLSVEMARFLGIPAANLKRDIMSGMWTIYNEAHNYRQLYEMEKFLYDPTASNNQKEFVKILFAAQQAGDQEAYQYIRQDLVASGVEEKKLDDKLGAMIKDETVEGGKMEEQYHRVYDAYEEIMKVSPGYQSLTAEQQEKVQSSLSNYATGKVIGEESGGDVDAHTSNEAKAIAAAEAAGVDPVTWKSFKVYTASLKGTGKIKEPAEKWLKDNGITGAQFDYCMEHYD